MSQVLKPRRGRASTIAAINPVLENGEVCLEFPDTGVGTGRGRIKVGDGVTPYNDLHVFLDFDETAYIPRSEKGQPDGVVPLDGDGKIAKDFFPSFVDNVLIYNSASDFPVPGEEGKIYIDISTEEDNTYRWDNGSLSYVLISKSVNYHLEKDKSSVVLIGTDGSRSEVPYVAGIEIRSSDPDRSELYPGRAWVLINQ